MKIAVDDQSGPCSTALTAAPIQLSPTAIEVPLCCDVAPLLPPWGSRIEKLGRVPFCASVVNWLGATMFSFWLVSRQAAKVRRIAQSYPLVKSFQDKLAASSRSMIVSTCCTGVGRYAPPFGYATG